MSQINKPSVEKLQEILRLHRLWLNGDATGSRADLKGANLENAYLSYTNLRDADLTDANLKDANLKDAKSLWFQIPQLGSLVVFKKLADGCIATMEIPVNAKRTATPIGRKCRAEKAFVICIEKPVVAADGTKTWKPISGAWSCGGANTIRTFYTAGAEVASDAYNADYRLECTNGIHFLLTREEAEAYSS